MASRKPNPVEGLPRFESRDVTAATVAIRSAGDGLSAALDVAPIAYSHNDIVFVVLECTVVDVQHPPATKGEYGGPLVRKHIFKAGLATVVDEVLVRDVLDAQAKLIEEAQGVMRLPLDDESVYED